MKYEVNFFFASKIKDVDPKVFLCLWQTSMTHPRSFFISKSQEISFDRCIFSRKKQMFVPISYTWHSFCHVPSSKFRTPWKVIWKCISFPRLCPSIAKLLFIPSCRISINLCHQVRFIFFTDQEMYPKSFLDWSKVYVWRIFFFFIISSATSL